jgi:hypothetical protein
MSAQLIAGGHVVTTDVRVFCAGPSHNHHQIVFGGLVDDLVIESAIVRAGFRKSSDGRWWCEKHWALGKKVS